MQERVLDRSTPLVVCWASEAWGRGVVAAYLVASHAQPDALDGGLCATEIHLARRPLYRCVSGCSKGKGRLVLFLTCGSA